MRWACLSRAHGVAAGGRIATVELAEPAKAELLAGGPASAGRAEVVAWNARDDRTHASQPQGPSFELDGNALS